MTVSDSATVLSPLPSSLSSLVSRLRHPRSERAILCDRYVAVTDWRVLAGPPTIASGDAVRLYISLGRGRWTTGLWERRSTRTSTAEDSASLSWAGFLLVARAARCGALQVCVASLEQERARERERAVEYRDSAPASREMRRSTRRGAGGDDVGVDGNGDCLSAPQQAQPASDGYTVPSARRAGRSQAPSTAKRGCPPSCPGQPARPRARSRRKVEDEAGRSKLEGRSLSVPRPRDFFVDRRFGWWGGSLCGRESSISQQ